MFLRLDSGCRLAESRCCSQFGFVVPLRVMRRVDSAANRVEYRELNVDYRHQDYRHHWILAFDGTALSLAPPQAR